MGIALTLVFVGGIIVVFLYVRSLSFNIKIRAGRTGLRGAVVVGLLALTVRSGWAPTSFRPGALYRGPSSQLMTWLIVYLLVVLVMVSKLVESFKGALVEKF